jgi:hypothetical protein
VKVVIFLQNAWSPLYAGRTWPRDSWLRALVSSRSGQRLQHLVDDWNECENTTPHVGPTPDSVIPPDRAHILDILATRKPDVVIACGKQAERALAQLWPGPMLAVPHPAHRLLTTDLYLKANQLLGDDFNRRLVLRQRKGRVEIKKLSGRPDPAEAHNPAQHWEQPVNNRKGNP